MRFSLSVGALLMLIQIALAASFSANDLVGAWTLGTVDRNYARYTFWSDHLFTGSQGDMTFEGHWKLAGQKLTLSGSRSDAVIITGFSGNALHVTLQDGKKDVWKKMPRWKGSPKY